MDRIRRSLACVFILCAASCARKALLSKKGPALSSVPDNITLYLVPIGRAPVAEIEALVGHYRDKFGFESRVLAPMMPVGDDEDLTRGQLIAENLGSSLLRAYPDYARQAKAILIGITGQDMYPRSIAWRYCFGWRFNMQRAAVVSTARMDLHYPDEPPSEATVAIRLRKVVTKDVGILLYNMNQSKNPRSVLYGRILSLEDLDQASEDFLAP